MIPSLLELEKMKSLKNKIDYQSRLTSLINSPSRWLTSDNEQKLKMTEVRRLVYSIYHSMVKKYFF